MVSSFRRCIINASKKNNFILLFALIAFTFTVGNAVPDSAITGPYKISFDIGTSDKDYLVVVNDPVIDETLGGEERTEHSITIADRTERHFMTISVITVKSIASYIRYTGSQIEEQLRQSNENDPRVSNFVSDSRNIDGVSGAVASMNMKMDSEAAILGEVVLGYNAMYPPAFDPSNSMVNIVSIYPWNEGTLQLLNTIHIEKV
jgi:hypothetical protein